MSKEKISTDGGQGLGQNPFAALSGLGLPPSETGNRKPEIGGRRETGISDSIRAPHPDIRNQKSRGRVDIRRETGGRGA